MEKGYQGLRGMPLSVYELYNATSNEAFSVASKEKYKNGLDLVVVDYIQVLRDVPGDERVNVNQISRNLKMMARLLNVVVIAPSQVTRKAETGNNGEGPLLHQLRESGNIESDADLVFLLYRDIMGDHGADTKLTIGKNRKGSTGGVDIKFDQETTKFYE
jgi:replicative DNA helicase